MFSTKMGPSLKEVKCFPSTETRAKEERESKLHGFMKWQQETEAVILVSILLEKKLCAK